MSLKEKLKKYVPYCLETFHGLETWELRRQFPFMPSIRWWGRSHEKHAQLRRFLEPERNKSTKQSLVLRSSQILPGKCGHGFLSRRKQCALISPRLSWKCPRASRIWSLRSFLSLTLNGCCQRDDPRGQLSGFLSLLPPKERWEPRALFVPGQFQCF